MDKKARIALTIGLLSLLSACGGGGDSGAGGGTPPVTLSVSGKAAAGGVIIGSVTIKDSSVPAEEKLVAISTDGSYTFDVSDMTAPFMMRANGTVGGTSYSIYSAATSADINGTVNITPLTDLIVANIAGQLAENYFNAGTFTGMTTTELNAAETALQARLQPVLTAIGLDSTIDLLRTSFNPDHTGLDAALDILRVTTDTATGIATITNLIDNIAITDDLASQADASIITASASVATGLTDFQQIAAGFATLTGYFATSLPASNNAGLNALFDSTNFLFEGDNLATFLTQITTMPLLIGAQFYNVALEEINSTTAKVSFVIQYSGRKQSFVWQMNKPGLVWLAAGDQRIGYVSVNALASYENSAPILTGLGLEANRFNTTAVTYAIVTGSGLPTSGGGADGLSAGALLFKNISNDRFPLAAAGAPYNGGSTTTAPCQCSNSLYVLSDTQINAISDGAVYTITLYNDMGTASTLSDDVVVATYTDKLAKRPYLLTALSAASFPAITTSAAAIAAAATAGTGGNITINWTLPTGISSESVHFWRSYASGNDSIDEEVLGSATSGTLTLATPSGTVSAHGVGVYAYDAFDREFIFSISN